MSDAARDVDIPSGLGGATGRLGASSALRHTEHQHDMRGAARRPGASSAPTDTEQGVDQHRASHRLNESDTGIRNLLIRRHLRTRSTGLPIDCSPRSISRSVRVSGSAPGESDNRSVCVDAAVGVSLRLAPGGSAGVFGQVRLPVTACRLTDRSESGLRCRSVEPTLRMGGGPVQVSLCFAPRTSDDRSRRLTRPVAACPATGRCVSV